MNAHSRRSLAADCHLEFLEGSACGAVYSTLCNALLWTTMDARRAGAL